MVGVQHRARRDGVKMLLGALVPGQRDQPVEVGADHARLARLLAHALEPSELLGRLLVGLLGHLRGLDLRAVLLDDRRVVLAELLADRVHLLAQEVVALLLVGALLDVVADALADLELLEALALQLQRQLEAVGHIDGAQQLEALLVVEVRAVAARVGQHARLADRAQPAVDARIGAAQLEDLLDDGAVLARERARASIDGHLIGALLDLDEEVAVGTALRGPDQRAVLRLDGHCVGAAGQAHALGHGGHHADLGELPLVARNEHDAFVIADRSRERDAHAGEDDGVIEGY